MLNWDDIRTVGLLVRAGSLAGAAGQLGVNYTTVARRIARAEDALGEPLFERLADGYRPTETAKLIAEHALTMETAEHAMMRQITGRDARLSGPLTITAPQLLVARVLAPVIERFAEAHPDVDLRVNCANDVLDLTRREADLAIRVSRNPGDTLTGLRLTPQHAAAFATPAWADRIARDPAGPIDWIVYDGFPIIPAVVTENHPGSRVRYRFDDMVAMVGAAAEGLGVVRTAMFVGRTTPGLVELPILPPQPYADLWVVAHADVWPSARVKAFRDLLVPHVRALSSLFVA